MTDASGTANVVDDYVVPSKAARLASFEATCARVLEAPRLGLWLAVASMCLAGSSLFIGFHLDDFVGRYIYSHAEGAAELYDAYAGGYGIASGKPDQIHWQIEQGYAPWWTYPKLLISMWRPLGLLTHLFDFGLFPNSAFAMHAHNLLWLGAAVFAASRLYRGVMGPLVGGFAAMLYAFDHTHGFPASFICNRYVLLCATFGALALEQHCRSRTKPSLRAAVLGPLLYAAALLSGEPGLSVLLYVAAYAAFVDTAPLVQRAVAVAPYLVVTVLWRAVYAALGHGGRFSGLYIDPAREPLHFLGALVERSPILVLGELFAPPSELYMLAPAAVKPIFYGFSLVFLVVTGVAILPLLRRDRVARFWAAGALLSVFPVCATQPNNRLLFFVSLGAMGLLAQLGNLYARQLRSVGHSLLELLSAAYSAVILLVHLVISPILLPFVACSLLLTSPIKRAFADVGPDVLGKDAVFVTSPDQYSVKLMPMQRRVDGDPMPRRWRMLSTGDTAVSVTRTDDRTLVLRYAKGILSDPLLELYRDRRLPMAPGDTVTLEGLSIVVLAVTADGRAQTVRFAFDTPLDAPSFHFYYWSGRRFDTFAVPAVGAATTLPPATITLGL